MSVYVYRSHATAFGRVHLIADADALVALAWDDTIADFMRLWSPRSCADAHPILDRAVLEIEAFAGGSLQEFTVPWELRIGTDFQRLVWQSLAAIPFGETRSYSEMAATVQRPKAVRAVGAANGKNPLSLILPCHRVIGKSGTLTGYAGGLQAKQRLLEIERSS